ncbi:MAG: PorT family protein [Cyclobacteriaceae bacterium]|nr:PorT family protein [Cyclobacteriaceae bacterium]MDW8332056.1 porin family protein [Cyclobacteriaceae bacterium]
MKKTILTIAGVAILSLCAFSQAQFALGLKGGLNFAKFDATDVSGSLKNKTGFNGGAFALIKLTKIGIQPELLFSQQGSKFEFDGNNIDNNFDYINIPVILKLYTVAGINIQAGPQFGFLTRAEIDGSNVKDSFKGSDLSLALGMGWDLPFGLTFDARYNLGLTKIDESDPGFDAVKNQVIQLSVGYKIFKFGK